MQRGDGVQLTCPYLDYQLHGDPCKALTLPKDVATKKLSHIFYVFPPLGAGLNRFAALGILIGHPTLHFSKHEGFGLRVLMTSVVSTSL
jgi:hypothetical protein